MKKPNLVIIHGLNNNRESFESLIIELSKKFNVKFIELPGHETEPIKLKDKAHAFKLFDTKINQAFPSENFFAIGFSLGGLFLEYWNSQQKESRLKKQVLISPAISIRNFSILNFCFKFIPQSLNVFSFMPKNFRRFKNFNLDHCRIMLHICNDYHKENNKFPLPTLVFFDKKDELLSYDLTKKITKKFKTVKFKTIKRPYLLRRMVPAKHHYTFHPEFYSKDGWKKLIDDIESFFLE